MQVFLIRILIIIKIIPNCSVWARLISKFLIYSLNSFNESFIEFSMKYPLKDLLTLYDENLECCNSIYEISRELGEGIAKGKKLEIKDSDLVRIKEKVFL